MKRTTITYCGITFEVHTFDAGSLPGLAYKVAGVDGAEGQDCPSLPDESLVSLASELYGAPMDFVDEELRCGTRYVLLCYETQESRATAMERLVAEGTDVELAALLSGAEVAHVPAREGNPNDTLRPVTTAQDDFALTSSIMRPYMKSSPRFAPPVEAVNPPRVQPVDEAAAFGAAMRGAMRLEPAAPPSAYYMGGTVEFVGAVDHEAAEGPAGELPVRAVFAEGPRGERLPIVEHKYMGGIMDILRRLAGHKQAIALGPGLVLPHHIFGHRDATMPRRGDVDSASVTPAPAEEPPFTQEEEREFREASLERDADARKALREALTALLAHGPAGLDAPELDLRHRLAIDAIQAVRTIVRELFPEHKDDVLASYRDLDY